MRFPPLLAVPLLAATIGLAACGDDADRAEPAAATPGSAVPSASTLPEAAGPRAQVPVTVPAGMTAAPFDRPRTLELPGGWTASVYARISRARFIAPTPDGNMLVSQPSTGKVLLLKNGQVSDFVTGLRQPHDIVFASVGGRQQLFIAESHRVMRHAWNDGDTTAQPGQVAVDGLPDNSTPELRGNYGHYLKNIAVYGNTLYVSIASTCNACVSDTRSDPQRATIYTYDAAGSNAGRKLFARGLRNAEGLAFVPGTDELWVVVNNRDNTLVPDDRDADGDGRGDRGKRVTAFVDDYPVEPFTRVVEGGFYGWPFCNPNSDNGVRKMPFHRDYELNRDGTAADCAKATPIDVGLDAHSAPLGLTFTKFGAVIAQHGSWNSSRPKGYKVIYFPWTPQGPGEQRDLVTGFLEADGRAWGRPVDVAVDRDGSLLVTDDAAGAVYRLVPPAA
jgi:glucose/arabinose dehydrogenase